MSVYIRGMEMPKCCDECVALHDDGNSLTCLITHEPRGYMFPDTEERMSNCPLIPVPEEHGDLIDKQYAYQNTMPLGEHTRKIVLKQIDALPVVIPADREVDG